VIKDFFKCLALGCLFAAILTLAAIAGINGQKARIRQSHTTTTTVVPVSLIPPKMCEKDVSGHVVCS
jgi:hypothetical protein